MSDQIPFLLSPVQFPNPEHSSEEGIVAVGGDLSVDTLLKAYSSGIFPWFSEHDPYPIWYCPEERMVLEPGKHKVSASMKQLLKKGNFIITFDTCFARVIDYCARVYRQDQGGTWITKDMQVAYIRLHETGFAHSLEVWQEKELVGGLYGVSLGGIFCGESMFSLVPNASKVAFIKLSEILNNQNFKLIDCQNYTPHLESLGASLITRIEFLSRLKTALQLPTKRGNWRFQ